MIGDVGHHRADHGDVVDVFGHVRKQFADFDAALAVFLELERRGKRGPGLALGQQVAARQLPARVFRQRRLGIERIDLRRPAVGNKWMTRFARGAWGGLRASGFSDSAARAGAASINPRQGQGGQAHARASQQFPPRKRRSRGLAKTVNDSVVNRHR